MSKTQPISQKTRRYHVIQRLYCWGQDRPFRKRPTFFFILHRGSASQHWYRGTVAHCSAPTGSLTGAHADRGWLVWCPPRPHHFPWWSSLPAAFSGPAASCVKGLCESSLPLTVILPLYFMVLFYAFKPLLLKHDYVLYNCYLLVILRNVKMTWHLIAILNF